MTNYIIYIICIIFIITIIFYLFNSNIVEHYCKTPELNSQDEINDKNVLLSYPPQSNIFTSSRLEITTFEGLISLWTMPFECA